MNKKLLIIIIILTILLNIGCTSKGNIGDNIDEQATDDLDLEFNLENQALAKNELYEKLLESTAIELKTKENETIGIIREREEVVAFIERLFNLQINDAYTSYTSDGVIGPINFYLFNNQPIYALMNENYIYIEGYYFLFKQEYSHDIIQTFLTQEQKVTVVED